MKRLAAILLLMVSASPSLAGDDFPFPALSNELDANGLVDAPEIDPSPDYDGSVGLVGGVNLVLDLTPMSVVTTLFDIGPQTYQHLGYTTTWACFTDAGRRVWYIADLTYETRDDTYIANVIDEPDDPATSALFLCKPEPRAMLEKNPALPAIGTSLAELNAFYKTSIPRARASSRVTATAGGPASASTIASPTMSSTRSRSAAAPWKRTTTDAHHPPRSRSPRVAGLGRRRSP